MALTLACSTEDYQSTQDLRSGDQTVRPDADGAMPDGMVRFDLPPRPDAPTDGGLDAALDAAPDVTLDVLPDVAPDLAPSTHLVIITEMMVNPAAVGDAHGEWIELYNASMHPINLDGWTIKDEGSDSHVISGPVNIASGAYLLLGVDDQPGTNGGVTVAAVVNGFSLDDSADEVVLLDNDGKLVDRIVYDQSWALPSGASMQLRDISLDNSVGGNWCAAVSDWGGAGDLGTPTASNVCAAVDAGVDAPVDAGPVDAGPIDAAADVSGPPTCPPSDASAGNPASGLGDLEGQSCDYACWGNGTIYNVCAAGMWQFCLSEGAFAPCQTKP